MLGYYLFIAWKSLRRTPGNTLLIVAGIALGVAVATLFSAIRHAYAKDPIPEKSSMLHYVRMDSWDPQKPHSDGIPPQITYRDMIEIMKSDIPVRQSGSFYSSVRVTHPTDPSRAWRETGRLCHADFFAMFNIPFRYGSAWDQAADKRAERVVVLSEELNNRLFAGEDSVGRLLSIEDRDFRVVGVLSRWPIAVRFYDLMGDRLAPAEPIFIPMSLAQPTDIWPRIVHEWKPREPGFEGFLASEAIFIRMWVELQRPDDVAAYKSFLDAYAIEQKRIGRFQRPLDNRVTPLLEYMKEQGCTPPEATATMIVANLFLGACALSLMGLLMARFLAHAPEIGVRRALGATRWDIFAQHLIECEVVAFAGGLLGLALASAGLLHVNWWFKRLTIMGRDDFFQVDLSMAWFAAAAAVAAGLLAGVYPAHRVCRIPPAAHLKLQ